ncbi:DNA polymerase III subunit chi [Oricola cellulosilytica]|uniref:DNA polymerase III subunit chi n=1 Tax=Oricola cellulosilytica TaxID=1429082 RepID=A0A4R0PFP8_9HYPH|nr:DNA polymerase III subunit chi [Oricola cellulosilytica]TCD14314.1 DNA polymerase III subunit chi [Oricola cellulosilytica]
MSEVFFYHLTESSVDEALPALVEKSVARGWRAAIQSDSAELRDRLDTHLWTYRPEGFLAHGADGCDHPESQPVLLTTETANPNGADIRFLIGRAEPPDDLSGYERVVLMFDGLDEDALASARGHWKALKAAGHQLTYWQQDNEGRWERKA